MVGKGCGSRTLVHRSRVDAPFQMPIKEGQANARCVLEVPWESAVNRCLLTDALSITLGVFFSLILSYY
jgi:hypothetical protein